MSVLRPVGPVLSAQVGASKASGGLGIVVGMSIGPERGRSRCVARAIHPYISHCLFAVRFCYGCCLNGPFQGRIVGAAGTQGFAATPASPWAVGTSLSGSKTIWVRAIPDRESATSKRASEGNPQNATRYRASPELTTNHTKYTKRKTPMRKSFTALPFRAKEHSNTIPKALPWADGTGPTGRKTGIWKRKWSKNPCRITLLEV